MEGTVFQVFIYLFWNQPANPDWQNQSESPDILWKIVIVIFGEKHDKFLFYKYPASPSTGHKIRKKMIQRIRHVVIIRARFIYLY